MLQSRPTPIELGWREWLALPELGIAAIRAKVDTGARTSALHVEHLEIFESGGEEWVSFTVAQGRRARVVHGQALVIGRREVTDSGGHRQERLFIRTPMRLGTRQWEIEINLTQRANMLFPMLLGRTALVGGYRVDPQRSFVMGRPHAHAEWS